jgi:hypothetical protein
VSSMVDNGRVVVGCNPLDFDDATVVWLWTSTCASGRLGWVEPPELRKSSCCLARHSEIVPATVRSAKPQQRIRPHTVSISRTTAGAPRALSIRDPSCTCTPLDRCLYFDYDCKIIFALWTGHLSLLLPGEVYSPSQPFSASSRSRPVVVLLDVQTLLRQPSTSCKSAQGVHAENLPRAGTRTL